MFASFFSLHYLHVLHGNKYKLQTLCCISTQWAMANLLVSDSKNGQLFVENTPTENQYMALAS